MLQLIKNKSTEEEIIEEVEDIELPHFDIIVHTEDDLFEGNWFTDMMEEQEEAIKQIKRDHNIH